MIEYDYSYIYDTIGNRTSIDDTNFSDNFNRADSTNLGSDWSEVVGNWEILSNRLSIPDASDNAVYIYTGGDFWVIGRYQNGTWTDSTAYNETINKVNFTYLVVVLRSLRDFSANTEINGLLGKN